MSEKTAEIEALAGFIIQGREPAKAGDRLTVPEWLARELIHTRKAVRVNPEVRTERGLTTESLSTQTVPVATQTAAVDTPEAVSSGQPGKRFKPGAP